MPDRTGRATVVAMRHAVRSCLDDYRSYNRRTDISRGQTETLLRSLHLDMRGTRVLELGPGAGSGLDVFSNHGAIVRFIERNPLLAFECIRRGHKGRSFDFVHRRDRLMRGFDLVYARGSITPGSFADGRDFGDWLRRFDGGRLILCPWIDGPPPEWFKHALEDAGCRRTGWIEGYCVSDIYPDVWARGVEFRAAVE